MSAKELVMIVSGVVMIVVGTYFFTTLGPHVEAIEKGELIPFEVDDQKPFDIQMGGCHALVTADELSKGFDFQHAFYFGGIDYPFTVSLRDGKVLVSAEIRNANGDVVAKIADNSWSVDYTPILTYDRNYNSYAFEAISSDKVPILQVVMTPENIIFVGGVFYGENATLVNMLNGTTVYNPTEIKYNQTIFQYPSDSKLGKLVAGSPYAFGSQVILAPTEITAMGYVLFGIGTFVTLFTSVITLKKRSSSISGGRRGKAKQKTSRTRKQKR